MSDRGLLRLAADITVAFCTRNRIAAGDVPDVIKSVFEALDALGTTPPPRLEPAVAIRDSVKPDYIVCLEDGRKLKMLRRHLRLAYNLTPEQYREKWRLRRDYPMVAPNYSLARSRLAVGWGLGRARRRSPTAAADPAEGPAADTPDTPAATAATAAVA